VWRSSVTLFEHATTVTENNYLAYSNLGMALASKERLAEAEQSFRRVLEIDPPHFPAQTLWENDYMIRYALGVTLLKQNRFDEAGEQFRRVLERMPDYIDVNNHYGVILAMQGRLDEARTRFETALRYNPRRAPAHANLARLDLIRATSMPRSPATGARSSSSPATLHALRPCRGAAGGGRRRGGGRSARAAGRIGSPTAPDLSRGGTTRATRCKISLAARRMRRKAVRCPARRTLPAAQGSRVRCAGRTLATCGARSPCEVQSEISTRASNPRAARPSGASRGVGPRRASPGGARRRVSSF
jgi:tetratricopeptide (TPR) repeat protein